jgi:hypothetical protein
MQSLCTGRRIGVSLCPKSALILLPPNAPKRHANANAMNKYHFSIIILLDHVVRRCLHFSCAICPFLAVVRVNSAPQFGHVDLAAAPDFSR